MPNGFDENSQVKKEKKSWTQRILWIKMSFIGLAWGMLNLMTELKPNLGTKTRVKNKIFIVSPAKFSERSSLPRNSYQKHSHRHYQLLQSLLRLWPEKKFVTSLGNISTNTKAVRTDSHPFPQRLQVSGAFGFDFTRRLDRKKCCHCHWLLKTTPAL